jgi:hypothetical protein
MTQTLSELVALFKGIYGLIQLRHEGLQINKGQGRFSCFMSHLPLHESIG